VKITAELHQALDNSKRRSVSAQTILIDEATTTRCVGSTNSVFRISTGCIGLLNRLSHAKAIDETRPGYFKQYSTSLANTLLGKQPSTSQSVADAELWNFDTMNHQVSNFNQMANTLIAIEFAHHYLGHYKKHGPKLTDAAGTPVPINACLTEKEWHEAVVKGARNALDCGLGVDGLRNLFAAFDQMPTRPEWAAWFIHPKARVSKLDGELAALERDFFLVEK
jgi:hypothetical protein